MKFMKYTFRTPLYGSIESEELLSDTDGRTELSPYVMARMYTEDAELASFLLSRSEDLASFVPEELRNTVLRAEFGDFAMLDSKLYLRTYIWVQGHLTEEGIEGVKHWIHGQMSDGWGEGLEQTPWKTRRVDRPYTYFDEHTLDFEIDMEECDAYYYANPWNSDDFEVMLEDVEEAEEDIKFDIIASVNTPAHGRQVVKLRAGIDVKVFMRDFEQDEAIKLFEDNCPRKSSYMYLVRDTNAPAGSEILPKCIVETDSSGYLLYDMTQEAKFTVKNLSLVDAILELLK